MKVFRIRQSIANSFHSAYLFYHFIRWFLPLLIHTYNFRVHRSQSHLIRIDFYALISTDMSFHWAPNESWAAVQYLDYRSYQNSKVQNEVSFWSVVLMRVEVKWAVVKNGWLYSTSNSYHVEFNYILNLRSSLKNLLRLMLKRASIKVQLLFEHGF